MCDECAKIRAEMDAERKKVDAVPVLAELARCREELDAAKDDRDCFRETVENRRAEIFFLQTQLTTCQQALFKAHNKLTIAESDNAALKEKLQFTYCAYCGKRFDIADEEAAKKAAEEHIFKCQKHPVAALLKALDEATKTHYTVNHGSSTDYYIGKYERDYSRLSPASRALCERHFKEE